MPRWGVLFLVVALAGAVAGWFAPAGALAVLCRVLTVGSLAAAGVSIAMGRSVPDAWQGGASSDRT